MSNSTLVAYGHIAWLGINKKKVPGEEFFSTGQESLSIDHDGILGDSYRGSTRLLSGHDGGYIKLSGMKKGDRVSNHRPITGLETTEIIAAEEHIGQRVQLGMLRENIRFCLQPNVHGFSFSKLPPRSLIVIGIEKKVVLIANEENGPCDGVARPFSDHYDDKSLMKKFIQGFQGRRGQMISVMSRGSIRIDDPVSVYLPVGSGLLFLF